MAAAKFDEMLNLYFQSRFLGKNTHLMFISECMFTLLMSRTSASCPFKPQIFEPLDKVAFKFNANAEMIPGALAWQTKIALHLTNNKLLKNSHVLCHYINQSINGSSVLLLHYS